MRAIVIALLITVALVGCAAKRGVDFASIARQSSSTLDDITALEDRITRDNFTLETQDDLLRRTQRIRVMVLSIDIALIAAAGREFDIQQSEQINLAAATAHRHLQSFINRPTELFARSALRATDWDAFEAEADNLLSGLQLQVQR